jgi:nitroreductase
MSVAVQEIQEAFMFRFAAKKYDPERKISDKDFSLILETAQLSPSSYGFEPWNIIVVQDEALRKEFLDAGTWGAKGTLATASHFIVMTAKTGKALQPSDSEHLTHMLRDIKQMSASSIQGTTNKYADWQKNDFNLTTPELLHHWAARQAYIALGNMMTVAAMRCIDSQPIEGFNITKITRILVEHNLIDPTIDLPVVMVSFGYRAIEQSKKTRRPIDEIVKWI